MSDSELLQSSGGLASSLISQLESTAESLADGLFDLQWAIHEHPELAFQEHFAHKACTDYIEKQGFEVTRHAYGLQTAWKAVYEVGEGGPVIGFNSEMDALRGIGHACGHNLIAIAGIAAAVTTAHLLESRKISGKVILLGTPAEEAGGGKAYLLKRGAYDGMEACFMTHPGTQGYGSAISTLSCNAAFSVKYTGASAHAGAVPERGINALDAAVAAYSNIALLRQMLPDSFRVYDTIQGSEGWTANVIASESRLTVGVRCPTAKETYGTIDRVLNCLKAAALATGCQYEIRREALYFDMQQAHELDDYFTKVCTETWGHKGYTVGRSSSYASTDFGNISYHLPALHPTFSLPDSRAGDFPHSNTFASWTGSKSACEAAIQSAVSIAAVGTRMIVDRAWAKSVRDSWVRQMESIDGSETVSKIEKLVESFPLSPETSNAVCCGHDETNKHSNHV
ncbi:hypothetical protein BCR39DRAFT_501710 [Naematelia encephala]|uniref:Peptidase M20 domain-containing protein 2 n=1 Tax=Naematelia encephala TaxID=71784 RepID=A0A1Y2AI98_9TREE|nr:hypothetical protein BCR39DRAFT_501710 [Naematelia encephala]